jgi:hypothetical protein
MASSAVFSSLFPAASEYRQFFNDLTLCSTAGCNAPASDTCALATEPVVAKTSFSNFPTSAFDASGKLSASGLAAVRAAVAAGFSTSAACSTCSSNIIRVTVKSTGLVIYDAFARRLEPELSTGQQRLLQPAVGECIIEFGIFGACNPMAGAAASGVSSPSFMAAAVGNLAETPGFEGVTVSSVKPETVVVVAEPVAPVAPVSASAPTSAAQEPFNPALLGLAIGVPLAVLAIVALGVLAALRSGEWVGKGPDAPPQDLALRQASV